MATDIRQTGPQGYKQLQQQNQQVFDPSTATNEDWYRHLTQKRVNDYNNQPTEYVGLQAAEAGYGESQYDEGLTSASQLQDLGDIRYENQPWYDTLANGLGKMLGTAGTTFVSSLVGLPYGLFEAANQGRWSALWDNDVTQGLAEADKWLEENMTNYRSQVQQNSPWYDPENLFSMNFIADDVIKNMGFTLGAAASMAVGSGSLGLLNRSIGLVNSIGKGTKMGQAALSALFSATGEGMIEARQGVEERNKLEMQKLDDALLPQKQALELEFQQVEQEYAANRGKMLVMGPDGNAVDPAYEQYRNRMADLQMQRDALNQKYEAGKQQILESGQEMGNKILLANQGLLTLGNLIQFGKGMVKSFDSARHAAEVSSKAVKPTLVGAEKLADGTYKITGKNAGRALAATKGIFTEGSEEMNQQWIQSSSGASVNEADVNDYWKAKLDPEAYRETTKGLYTVGSILDRGFQESWGDVNQWEQFVIGGLTGMSGSYSPTKIFNQDKSKAMWDPRRYGSWEGGAFNELRDFNREYNQYQENIDDLNKILQSEDFPARIKSAVGHTFTQGEKDAAVEGDDKKAWKDADDKQMIHDIQAFLRAGKLDDLRTIYNELGTQLSDEDVQNIIKSTTKEITAEEDKQNFNRQTNEQIAAHQRKITELQQRAQDIGDSQDMLEGAERVDYQAAVRPELEKIFGDIDAEYDAISQLEQQKEQYVPQRYFEGAYVDREGNQIVSNDEIKQTVKHNSEELNRKLDSYLDSIDQVNRDTKGALTKDREDNLAYLHNLGKESLVRADKIISDKRKQMPSKFLMKTDKTPEQLTKEYASSDLVFSKDENTREGYVEVDTSLMDDRSFRNFFIGELLWGGNINPEFAETAEEKAAREEEEKNLSTEEKKKRAKERLSKKWKESLEKQKKDAEEQRDTNGDLIAQNFIKNYRKNTNTNQMELQQALNEFFQDIVDASSLVSQAGEYDRTLREYMANPSLVDKDKAEAEAEATKAADEQQAKNQFAGKDASEIKQGLADGSIDFDDFDDFAGADLSDVTDDDVKAAQQEVKKAQEGNQKASALKQHIQEQLGDNPSQQELNAAQAAMQMVDAANLATENPEDLNIDMPELSQIPLDAVDPNASVEDVDALNMSVQQMLADAFNAFEEDKNAQDDIPESIPTDALNDVEAPETGHDTTTKTKPEVVAPVVSSPSEAANEPLPKNPLTEGAIATIIDATNKVYDKPNTNGTWRSTTTRHPYGKSTGTYHETLTDKESIQYKRSKAIWEYLNSAGAFDRQENASADRLKPNDTVHFMVQYIGDVFGSRLEEVSDENKPYALVILMLNDNGEVIGDLPLAELEPSFRSGNPTQQVKDLMSLQKKVFDAFFENYKKTGANAAVVDGTLTIEGTDNLNLTFDGSKKPLLSKVKQVIKGVVPYRKSEINTLNDVANGQPFELGVAVTGTNVAKKRGDKTQHKEIVMPHVGTIGQPYLLLPTPSGEQIAVPFYMKPFDANQHRNTEMYKLLTNAIYNILINNTNKEVFKKNMDVIEGLLQVKVADGVKSAIDVRKDSVTMHLQSLTDANNKIEITVPFNQNTSELAMAMVDQLSSIPINVSLQFLNDTIEAGGRKANYNNVIGEIADVNLPKATNHTVNGWFTVELAPSAGIKPSKRVTPRTTGVITENIGGKSIEINTDTLVAYDQTTGEVITDNEEVNLRLAQIKAAKPQYQGKDRIQVSINGELRTYDVKENKFVKNAPTQKTQTPIQKIIANSKLLNKEEILAAHNDTDGFQIQVTPVPSLSQEFYAAHPEAKVFIVEQKGKLRVMVEASGDQVFVPEDVNKRIVDRYIPQGLQDYINNGERKKEDQAKIELSDRMHRENPNVTIDEIITAQNKMPNKIQDEFGIPFVNEYVGIIPETPDVSAVTPSTSGAVSFANQTQASSVIEIDVPTTTGESRKEKVQKVNPSELKKGDLVWYSGPDTENPIGQDTILTIENGEVWGNRGLIKSKAIYKVAPSKSQTQPKDTVKTLEQIESEMKQKKVVGRQTKDAWDAIPNDLKLKLVNEGQPLQLSFNGKTMVVSLSDREGLIQGLTQANMAAKAGNLTVYEAPKYRKVDNMEQKKADIQREKRWLQKNLPMFNSEERLKLIQGLIEIPGAEGWAWGRFESGIITLSDMAAAGTTYHEAFHAVTQTLLDDAELDALYEAAREKYKENDAALLEELLAEDFRKYVQREETPIIGFIRKIFRRIMHAMRNLDSYRDPINLLFYKINNGEFKDTLPRVSRGDNAFYRNIRTDRMLDKSHPMHKAIEKAFNAKDWNGNFNAINKKWKQFKSAWQAEGYTPIMQNVYNKDGKGKVVFLGVRTNADEAISLRENRQPKAREQYAAQQAREGGIERLQWSRLTPEQQMNLINEGMTEEAYNKMALEEKDQWVKCRA